MNFLILILEVQTRRRITDLTYKESVVKLVLIFISLLLANSCTPAVDATAAAPDGRWMDRTIYFANPDATDQTRNSFFQKSRVQEALTEVELSSVLGEGYFKFQEVDESTLNTNLEQSTSSEVQKSFILIWPDKVFNDYVLGTVNGSTPDPNAIAVINAANKRKFFIIIRASCFSGSTSSGPQCSDAGAGGLKALVARQLGLLVGMPIKDCTAFPDDVMCATKPSAAQFSENSKLRFAAALNNALETILLNTGYYN
jgi:hypothetical protein